MNYTVKDVSTSGCERAHFTTLTNQVTKGVDSQHDATILLTRSDRIRYFDFGTRGQEDSTSKRNTRATDTLFDK